jgi:hypothetical protein
VNAPGIEEAGMYGRDLRVTVADAETGPTAIRERLAAAGMDVRVLEPVDPTLEDVFTSLVRAEGGAVVG